MPSSRTNHGRYHLTQANPSLSILNQDLASLTYAVVLISRSRIMMDGMRKINMKHKPTWKRTSNLGPNGPVL